jgi:hypothetical protein
MTIEELKKWLADPEIFPNQNQQVLFEAGGTVYGIMGPSVSPKGDAVIKPQPAPKRKFMFKLGFEAYQTIEAATYDTANILAQSVMRRVHVVNRDGGGDIAEFKPLEPAQVDEEPEEAQQ